MKVKIALLLLFSFVMLKLYAAEPEFDVTINPHDTDPDQGELVYSDLNRNLNQSYLLQEGKFSFYDSTFTETEMVNLGLDSNGCAQQDAVDGTCDVSKNSYLIFYTSNLFAESSIFYVKGNLTLQLSDSSIFVIDKIQTYTLEDDEQDTDLNTGSPSNLYISVYDSSLFTNELKIVALNKNNPDDIPTAEFTSQLSLQFTNSSEESKGNNNSEISGKIDDDYGGENIAIGAANFSILNLTYYVLEINGDIVLGNPFDDNIDSGNKIDSISLTYSDLTFSGGVITGIGSMNLSANSNFLLTDPDASLTFVGGSTIIMSQSNFNVIDGEGVNNGHITLYLAPTFQIELTSSVFYVDTIDLFQDDITDYNNILIDAFVSSTVDINTIDLTNINQNPTLEQPFYLQIRGDSTSYVNVDTILIDNDSLPDSDEDVWTTVDLTGLYGDIGTIKVQDDELQISTVANTSTASDINIGVIELTSDTGNETLFLKDITLNINELDVYGSDSFILQTENVNANFNVINCNNCETVNFNGVGSSTDIVNINDFNNDGADSSTQNNFDSITVNVENSYNSSGTLSLTNDANVFIKGLSGDYTTFNVSDNSLFYIGEDSKFNLETANIEKGSTLFINTDNAFENEDVDIENNGVFILNGTDTFATLNNGTDSIALLNGDVTVETINNEGVMYLSNGATVDSLTSDNSIYITGDVYVNDLTLNQTTAGDNSQLNFIILDNSDPEEFGDLPNSTLHVEGEIGDTSSIDGLENTDINIWFQHSSIFVPGLDNYFTLVTNDSGYLIDPGLCTGTQEECVSGIKNNTNSSVYPPWLYFSVGISNNSVGDSSEDTSLGYWSNLDGGTINFDPSNPNNPDLGDNSDGQNIWINIQRLTDYQKLITATGNPYSQDQSLVNMASTIDAIVADPNSTVTAGLNDVVNSLDFNSGCGASDNIIYQNHNDPNASIDVSSAPCVITMSQNMETLKPINNEIFLLSTHTIVSKEMYNMVDINRSYNKVGDVKVWGTNSLNADYAKDKNYVAGYSSYGDSVQLGATTSLFNNFNLTSAIGFNVSQLSGNHDLYDSGILGFSYGAAASYVASNYYLSVSALMAKNIYSNARNMYFLNNSFSANSSVVSNSDMSVNELIASFEIGTEIAILNDTFLVPKIFLSEGLVSNADYSEQGSSGDLDVLAFSTPITEVGVGVDIYRELLLPELFGQKNAFWYPKANISVMDRIYNVDTMYMFADTGDANQTVSYGADYSGILTKVSGGLEYNKNNVTISVMYDLEVGFAGYMDSAVNALFKYAL